MWTHYNGIDTFFLHQLIYYSIYDHYVNSLNVNFI